MMKRLFACFLGAVLSQLAVAETPQLIKNPRFEDSPDVSTAVEHHGNAEMWHLSNGSKLVPGWDLSGIVHLHLQKNTGYKYLNLCGGKGTASQVIATEPGKTYTLRFMYMKDNEAGKGQILTVQAGNKTSSFPVEEPRYYNDVIRFQAKAVSTRITFSSSKAHTGPEFRRVLCWEYDPAVETVTNMIQPLYTEMDRGEKNEKDLAKMMSNLTEDFSWRPLEGTALDRPGYEEMVRKRLEKKLKVNTRVEEVVINSDGSVTVEAVRQETVPGDYGKWINSSPTFKHTWVKVDKVWKLKEAQEMPAAAEGNK